MNIYEKEHIFKSSDLYSTGQSLKADEAVSEASSSITFQFAECKKPHTLKTGSHHIIPD
jgi:hypothetical protein